MSYNFRLKEFQNGTMQLTYYHNGVNTKEDFYKLTSPYDQIEYEQPDYDDDGNEFGYLNGITFEDLDKYAKPIKQDDLFLVLTEEQLKERRDRSQVTSLNRTKRMIYDYGRSNIWEWFFTLTFAPVEEFTAMNFTECSHKVSNWFMNIKKKYCPRIKYLAVPEQHDSGAWHFHCLVSNCDELTFEKAINQQKFLKDKDHNIVLDAKGKPVPNKYYGEYLRTSYPKGDFIYNIKQYKNGWSTATRIKDTKKAVSYCVKYITKDLGECTFGKQRYLCSKNLGKPAVAFSSVPADRLDQVISNIEYIYGVELSRDYIKSYVVDVPGYRNTISIFEFDRKGEFDEEHLLLRTGVQPFTDVHEE